MARLMGIAIGDVTGIGPEVTLKALASPETKGWDCRFLLFGDARLLRRLNQLLGTGLELEDFSGKGSPARIMLHDPGPALPEDLVAGSPLAARAAVAYLREGARRCLERETEVLVTAPVNKESIVRSGQPFVGQTEMLSEMAASQRTAMMLLGHDEQNRWLRVVLATTHVPIKNVSQQLTTEKIKIAIELAAEACAALKLPRARIGVCGLNPHAGEGGQMGDEEQTTIAPAVAACRNQKIDVEGPVSADALFHYAFKGAYDAVVAMYHDQGLVPLKMIGFENGVNWTLGLPFIRTSPDHGTAYDIAGKNKANPSSMLAALRLAAQLAGITR